MSGSAFLGWFQQMRLCAANQDMVLEPLSKEERRRYVKIDVPAGESKPARKIKKPVKANAK
jgi:hypothetical protein